MVRISAVLASASSASGGGGGTPLWQTLLLAILSSGVVASLVSTVISTLVTRGRDGREARAKVRSLLFEVESKRWESTDFDDFQKALAELEAAAMIARIPRSLVIRYSFLAAVARATAASRREEHSTYPERALPAELHQLLGHTTEILIRELWKLRRKLFWGVRYSAWVIDLYTDDLRERRPGFAWSAPPSAPVSQAAKVPKRLRNLRLRIYRWRHRDYIKQQAERRAEQIARGTG